MFPNYWYPESESSSEDSDGSSDSESSLADEDVKLENIDNCHDVSSVFYH